MDDDVFEALQALAEPLVDDVNSVLRRVLNLNGAAVPRPTALRDHGALQAPKPPTAKGPSGGHRSPGRRVKPSGSSRTAPKAPRAARGSLLPESEYEFPILSYLVECGGRAPASEVVEEIGRRLSERFTPTDWEALNSGDIRWRSRTQFVRLKLIKEGVMAKDAPRGMWEITDLGRTRLNGASA
ncbi:MAG: winged helix-turn-helix domain-containing protein [Actinomycetota bacterium]